MTNPHLFSHVTNPVLAYLNLERADPSLEFVDQLVQQYTRRVPWESIFRIAKRANTKELADCPRWPDEFWSDAIERGGGGTCFESNYAFFSLLLALGYEGYLTINNMGDSIGCHTAIVLSLNGQRWLVDVGIPIYAPIPLKYGQQMELVTPFHKYSTVPESNNRVQIVRDRHPRANIFTLIDVPVSDEAYRQATTDDYKATGLFLDKIIVNKILDDTPWRYNQAEEERHFLSFIGGKRVLTPISGEVGAAIAGKFDMEQQVVETALAAVAKKPPTFPAV